METTYESENYLDSFEHIANCPGADKTITQTITIDDGTGKLYDYILTRDLEWKEYYITPDFSTDPEKPTILDNTQIIPNITDTFDVVGFKFKDQEHDNNDNDIFDDILPVDYDFYEDGTQIEKSEDETVTQILSKPRTQNITQAVRYFTGWEVKSKTITLEIIKTNIPPVACNTLNASCFTVPMEVYTSCSTDQEDNPATLTINWSLYLDINSYIEISEDDEGNEIRTVTYDEDNQDFELQTALDNNPVFSWTYNNEGQYRLIETAIDTDGAETELIRDFPIIFKPCEGDVPAETQSVQASGEIEVEANTWQLCAIPMTNGYWDVNNHKIINDTSNPVTSTVKNVVVDQLEDIYGVQASDLFKVINTAVGDFNGEMYNYIPGFTKETSVNNFPLVFVDDDNDLLDDIVKFEICGFWIKAKDRNFKIKWGVVE